MNFKKKWLVIFLFSIVVFQTGVAAQSRNKDIDYIIGPKDLLKINVFNVPELNITVRVSEEGSITLPLLGNIAVEGLTRAQIETKLVGLLNKKYLKNPQVTIFIEEYGSKKVSIIGAVKKTGDFDLIGKKTLLELISLAGGLELENSGIIIVLRKYKNGRSRSLKIDLDELMVRGNSKYNIPLQAGDIINIPAIQHIDVYIFGQVKNPGHLKVKKDGSATLLRVIAQAGGFTDRARKSKILITRKVKGKEVIKKVNIRKILNGSIKDFPVFDNDIIHVGESIL